MLCYPRINRRLFPPSPPSRQPTILYSQIEQILESSYRNNLAALERLHAEQLKQLRESHEAQVAAVSRLYCVHAENNFAGNGLDELLQDDVSGIERDAGGHVVMAKEKMQADANNNNDDNTPALGITECSLCFDQFETHGEQDVL